MVAISLAGSGEGPGWAIAPGYSTGPFSARPISLFLTTHPAPEKTALPGRAAPRTFSVD